MEYSYNIFDKNPSRLAMILANNCRKRRLDKGMSRRSLSEVTGIPEPTLERFETKGKISLEAFLRLVVEFDWFDEMSSILSSSKFTTGEELETINKNQGREKGR
ncbi:MAG: helix-turn-helix domain-containing protein [Bacteroidales bacterium]|nr:helix-turn-helix domain-containing protein [Bacteroidales bacterium]